MSAPEIWMPQDSLRQERAVRPVGKLLGEWSTTWLAGQRCEITGGWGPPEEEGDARILLRDSGQWLVLGGKGSIMQIACAMLGEPERTDFTPADLRLLRRVASEALDDLAERLEAALPKHSGMAGRSDERWAVKVSLAGRPCFELSLDRGALSSLTRQTYRPEAAAMSLDPCSTALDQVAVHVAAHLGSSTLDLGQVANLEPGDVLLLDQVVEEPLVLIVADRKSSLRGALSQSDKALAVTLCEPQ
jgi:flagellar motor switch/type III secretory pathway protein FliN